MSKPKLLWSGLLLALYALFWVWSGGNGTPISGKDAESMFTRIEATYDLKREDAPAGSLLKNLIEMAPNDDGREFYAVNLETRKSGAMAAADEARYSEMVLPMLLKRGGHPVFVSERAGLMLGEYGKNIDRVAVVRYRSLRDLMDMVLDPEMTDAQAHKFGALEHTEVFITRPTISFVQVRLMVGMTLLIIGVFGWMIIGRTRRG